MTSTVTSFSFRSPNEQDTDFSQVEGEPRMKTAGSSDGYGGDNDDERVEGEAFGGGTGNVDNVAVEPPAAGGGGEVSGGEDTNYTCLELGRCPIKTVQKGTTWSRLYLMMFKAHLEDLGFTLQGPNPLADVLPSNFVAESPYFMTFSHSFAPREQYTLKFEIRGISVHFTLCLGGAIEATCSCLAQNIIISDPDCPAGLEAWKSTKMIFVRELAESFLIMRCILLTRELKTHRGRQPKYDEIGRIATELAATADNVTATPTPVAGIVVALSLLACGVAKWGTTYPKESNRSTEGTSAADFVSGTEFSDSQNANKKRGRAKPKPKGSAGTGTLSSAASDSECLGSASAISKRGPAHSKLEVDDLVRRFDVAASDFVQCRLTLSQCLFVLSNADTVSRRWLKVSLPKFAQGICDLVRNSWWENPLSGKVLKILPLLPRQHVRTPSQFDASYDSKVVRLQVVTILYCCLHCLLYNTTGTGLDNHIAFDDLRFGVHSKEDFSTKLAELLDLHVGSRAVLQGTGDRRTLFHWKKQLSVLLKHRDPLNFSGEDFLGWVLAAVDEFSSRPPANTALSPPGPGWMTFHAGYQHREESKVSAGQENGQVYEELAMQDECELIPPYEQNDDDAEEEEVEWGGASEERAAAGYAHSAAAAATQTAMDFYAFTEDLSSSGDSSSVKLVVTPSSSSNEPNTKLSAPPSAPPAAAASAAVPRVAVVTAAPAVTIHHSAMAELIQLLNVVRSWTAEMKFAYVILKWQRDENLTPLRQYSLPVLDGCALVKCSFVYRFRRDKRYRDAELPNLRAQVVDEKKGREVYPLRNWCLDLNLYTMDVEVCIEKDLIDQYQRSVSRLCFRDETYLGLILMVSSYGEVGPETRARLKVALYLPSEKLEDFKESLESESFFGELMIQPFWNLMEAYKLFRCLCCRDFNPKTAGFLFETVRNDAISCDVDSYPTLNEEQQESAQFVQRHPFGAVEGPPGTGKTQTGAALAAVLVRADKRVLFTAQSNDAAKSIADKLCEVLQDQEHTVGVICGYKNDRLRIMLLPDECFRLLTRSLKGSKKRVTVNEFGLILAHAYYFAEKRGEHEVDKLKDACRDHWGINERCCIKNPLYHPGHSSDWVKTFVDDDYRWMPYLQNHLSVVVCTCGMAETSTLDGFWPDVIIFDEAAHCLPVTALQALSLAGPSTHLKFLGDRQQLMPYNEDRDLPGPMKKGLMTTFLDHNPTAQRSLVVQHRMAPAISALVNKFFYGDKLVDYRTVRQWQDPLRNVFVEVDAGDPYDCTGGEVNSIEAGEIFEVVKYLQSQDSDATIGILSFYKAQVEHIKKRLSKRQMSDVQRGKIKVVTVDGIIGGEFDFVLLSIGKWKGPVRGGSFLNDDHRLCVAFSRGKRLHITFGHRDLILAVSGKLRSILNNFYGDKYCYRGAQAWINKWRSGNEHL